MKTLPNGLTVFNATPHPIRFWAPEWPEPVEVAVDTAINFERVPPEQKRMRPDKFTIF